MTDPAPLMQGKQGLIMGIANERSLAWGIAKAVHAQGAKVAVTYQGEALLKRVRPLADHLESDLVLPAEVTDPSSLDALFADLAPPTRRSSRAATSTPASIISSARC
jgi:enoyl-[acyl-carrier protein] reductase I